MLRALFYKKPRLKGARDWPRFSRGESSDTSFWEHCCLLALDPRGTPFVPLRIAHATFRTNDALWSRGRCRHGAQWVFIKLVVWTGWDGMEDGVGSLERHLQGSWPGNRFCLGCQTHPVKANPGPLRALQS